jgi:hypothetical protein
MPQYLLPWGIYVNKSLAEQRNIDVPPVNWNIDEYTSFTAHHSPEEFYGAMDVSMMVIRTGTKDFEYQLLNRGPNDPFLNVNSEPMRDLLTYVPIWAQNSLWPQQNLGNIDGGFMGEHWWWSFKFFIEGKLLTLDNDPWMMGDAAHPDRNHWAAVRFNEWDYYPRPSTPYVDNHVGIVLDPFVIRNYGDGGTELTEEQKRRQDVAWEFAKFWCADTRAWQARADQLFKDINEDDGTFIYKSAMNDSFPMVIGPEFRSQMNIWYQPEHHQRFSDANKMPGFQYVLELWEQGAMWDISDKSYPWRYDFEGSSREILYEWFNYYEAHITGAMRTDANWLDQMYSRLPEWNTQFNQRFADQFQILKEGIDRFYR